jgi:hypothetical protein
MQSKFVYRQHQAELMTIVPIEKDQALTNVGGIQVTDAYNITESLGYNFASNAHNGSHTGTWLENNDDTILIMPGTYRQVYCNAENGENFETANADTKGNCYAFDIEQEGSEQYDPVSETMVPITQTVRIQMGWNETVLYKLEAAASDHPDEDAPHHRCNVAAGYSGRMCQVCLQGFGRDGRYGCKRCSADPITTGLASIMGLCAAVGYVSAFVYVVIRDAGSTSTAGSVQKILLNHFQLISIFVNYPLKWPSELLSMFNYFSFLSDISEKVLDLDCALKDPAIFGWTNLEPFFLLQLFYSVIPIMMILGFCSFWLIKGGVLHCCCGGKRNSMENVKITLSDVPEDLKKKYESRLSHEKILAKQHMFKYAAKMTRIRNTVKADITDAVSAAHHRQEREEALHHISGLKRILKSTFKKTSELTKEDRTAVAKMRAREFVDYCRTHHIHLREIWLQYDLNHSGAISYGAFEHIVRSLGFVWTPDEMRLVCELFDGIDAKEQTTDGARKGNGRIELHNLVNFGKTTTDKIVVTILVILYILYPTVARQVFKLLACRGGFSDGPTASYLLYDLSLSCWTGTHLIYTLCIGVPTVVLYMLGFPLFIVYILSINKDKFGDDEVMFRYGVLHAGYRHKVFYWEAMISLRKASIIGVSVFTLTFGVQVQAFIGLFVVIMYMAITIRSMPYENDHLNNMENWSLGMAFLTLYCGLIFYSDRLPSVAHSKGLAWFLIVLNGLYVMWVLNTLLTQYCKRYGCRKGKHTKEMEARFKEAQKEYDNGGHCDHLNKKKSKLTNADRMALGLGKFSGMKAGSKGGGSSMKLEKRDIFLSRLKYSKKTGLLAKFRTRARDAVHMERAYQNIRRGEETLQGNKRRQQLRRKGSKNRLNNRLLRRKKLKMNQMLKMKNKAREAQQHVTMMQSHAAMIHPMKSGGAAPAPGSFEAFQLKKQQDEFQAFLDNKRKAEMAQFAAMNQRAPKHTAEEVKKEMKSFVDEHQHNSCEDIKKDLHDFVQEGHTKAEVKAIIQNNPDIKKVMVKEWENEDDMVDDIFDEDEEL